MVLHYKECKCPKENIVQLNKVLSEQIVYDKIAMLNTRLQTDWQVRNKDHPARYYTVHWQRSQGTGVVLFNAI